MRRGGRLAAAFLVPTFLVQSTGAADLAFLSPVRAPILLSAPPHMPPPSRNLSLIKARTAPRVVPPDQGLWGALRDRIAPTVNAWDAWLDQPMELPDPVAWLASFAEEDPRPLTAPVTVPEVLPEPVPVSDAASDRMLIDHHDFNMVLFGQDARDWRGALPVSHEPVAPRLDGPWRQANGLRYRINYLKPEGYFKVGRGEVEVTEGSMTRRFQRDVPLPSSYWRTYALYHEGDMVDYEIEVDNLTGRDLEDLLVFTDQEGFNFQGGMGRLLGRVQLATLKSLAKDDRAVLMGRMRISGFDAAGGNFEQTHLTVDAQDAGGLRTRLVDDPQANIVDPPRSREP